jgi:hypothetical protein
MALSRSLSVFLRSVLVQQHPWFSCCASCGEIGSPPGNRLCASLTPDFHVDAVLPDTAAGTEGVRILRRRAPRLCRIFVEGETEPAAAPGIKRFTAAELVAGVDNVPAEYSLPTVALLHLLTDLTEQYLVVMEPETVPTGARVADFFTPNGIPLIYCREDVSLNEQTNACAGCGCFAQTRQNSADFLSVILEGKQTEIKACDYAAALFRWTYAEARAVPVPYRAG